MWTSSPSNDASPARPEERGRRARLIVERDGRSLVVAPMTASDVGEVAALYRAVWIHRGNYMERLDPRAPGNFARAGGMFLIQGRDSLASRLADEREFFWTAKGEDGRVLGAFWCGLDDPRYRPDSNILPPELGERLTRARQARSLYFSREILISPGHRGGLTAEALFYAGMRHFFVYGYKETCGEVYRVDAIRDERGERAVNLYNEASHNMLTRTGCRREGAFTPVTVRADGFEAIITMQVLTWDLTSALRLTRRALEAAGASLREERL